MKLHRFDSYEEYINAQIIGSKQRPNRGPCANEHQTLRIVQYLMSQRYWPRYGICHGARCGTEVDLFRKYLPKSHVIGTDVAPRKDCVIEWDFQQQKLEWIGHFDFVYSNSFDHSNQPIRCAATWLEQLTPRGFLFVVWSPLYTLECTRHSVPCSGGDCFGASLEEYVKIFEKFGIIRDLIYCCRNKWGVNLVIVVQKRQ